VMGNWKAWPSYLVHYLFQIITPLLIFYFWMMFADPVTDRSASPWGFFFYRAYPAGVLTSPFEPHWQWLSEKWLHLRSLDFEARSYIGLVAITGLIALLVRWIRSRYNKEIIVWGEEKNHDRFLLLQLLSGLAIVVFACGV